MKDKDLPIIISIILLIGVGVLAAHMSGFKLPILLKASTTPTGDFIPSYTTNPGDKLFKRMYGTVDCFYTGTNKAPEGKIFSACPDNGICGSGKFAPGILDANSPEVSYVYYLQPRCTSFSGTCRTLLNSYSCNAPMGVGHKVMSEIMVDNGGWMSTSNDITINQYVNVIKLRCAYYVNNAYIRNDPLPYVPGANIIVPLYKLRVESHGELEIEGWLPGTEDCYLKGNYAEILHKNQPTEQDNLNVESIRPGETTTITVSWKEVPGFGNVVTYNNEKVVCAAYDGLYKVRPVGTFGGANYYQQTGDAIFKKNINPLFCCDNSNCAGGGYVCENYQCTYTPTCPGGTCSEYEKGIILYTNKEIEEAGKFFLETATCGNDLCIQKARQEVKCTQSYCDRMSTYDKHYTCDYSQGCLLWQPLQPCPNGWCCDEGNGIYTTQACTSDKQCCKESSVAKWGLCQVSCTPPIDCNLAENKNKPECQVCIIDGIDYKLPPEQCCLQKGGQWVTERKGGIGCTLFGLGCTETSYCKYAFDWTKILIWVGGGIFVLVFVYIIMSGKGGRKRR